MKQGAEGSHTAKEFMLLCEAFGWKCVYCRRPISVETVTEDHVIPLSRGGSDAIENVAPACGSCNSRKRTMTGEEFLLHMRKEKKL
jgi:5-methylcytosine-specific restriction endonuclease McrA